MTGGDVGSEELVGGLGDCPWEFLEVQAVVDYTAGPDVDQTGIVCYGIKIGLLVDVGREMEILLTFTQELFWCDVGLATTQSCRHMYGLFPREAIDG